MADERLRLTAEMRDRLTPALRRLQTVISATGRADAFKKLAVDMSRLERAGYRAGFVFGRTLRYGIIGAAGAATIAGASFVKFGKSAADALDDISDWSKQLGWSADSLRTLEGVGKHFAVSQDAIRSSITKMNTSLGRLKQGQGALAGYLAKVNPALGQQLRHAKSSQEAFLLLSDAISKTTDPAKRAALVKATGLGQEFLRFFADGPDELRKWTSEVKRLQGTLGDKAYDQVGALGDSFDAVGFAWKGLVEKLTVSAVPVVAPFINDLAESLVKNREIISKGFAGVAADVGAGLRSVGKWLISEEGQASLKAFWSDLRDIAVALAEVAKAVNSVVQSFGGWRVVVGALVAMKVAGKMKGFLGSMMPGGGSPGAGGKPGGTSGQGMWTGFLFFDLLRNLPTSIDELSASMQAAKERSDAWNKSIESWLPRWLYSADGWGGGGPSHPLGNRDPLRQQYLQTQIDAMQPRLDKMKAEYDQWIAAGKDKTDPERFARFADEYRKLSEAYTKLQNERARLLEEGAARAGRKFGESAAESLVQRMSLLFGAGRGGGGFQQAVYRAIGPAIGATRAAFGKGSMLDLIASAEGTGKNYNTTLGYGRLTGGPVNLVGMTLDQIDALQTRMLRHPANRWNSSAVGRYQFVRTRLRDLRRRYGLPGSAIFSPELQDTLAKLSLAERGGSVGSLRNEWEGLRRVPATILRDAIRRHERRREDRAAGKIEGSASVDIRFPNGVPAGTRVGASGKGLFREVHLDTGRAMKPALA